MIECLEKQLNASNQPEGYLDNLPNVIPNWSGSKMKKLKKSAAEYKTQHNSEREMNLYVYLSCDINNDVSPEERLELAN
jgi:hypothetical protein